MKIRHVVANVVFVVVLVLAFAGQAQAVNWNSGTPTAEKGFTWGG